MIIALRDATPSAAAGFFLVANLAIFTISVACCWLLGRGFRQKRLFERWEPLRISELFASCGAIFLNAAISMVGWLMWRNGWIELAERAWWWWLPDMLLMLLVMDLGMYVFHRLAHVGPVYRLVHAFHHRHTATNPISLFVLHPAEVLGFGALMLVWLMIYPISLAGLLGYLTFNVVFGTLGHCGVEPLPARMVRIRLLRLIGTSTFHAGHHHSPNHNFGFYTLLWDRLFGTLDPNYPSHLLHGINRRADP